MTALKTLIFIVIVPGTATVLGPYLLLSLSANGNGWRLELGIPWALGLIPILLGAAIYLWCARDFVRIGRGTPSPTNPPRELIVRGLYRFVRNPMYIGVLLVMLGEAALFQSVALLVYTAAFAVFFHLFVVLYEEPTLRGKFGASYEQYLDTVSRWIPRASALRQRVAPPA
jgi:protein-S-isoprenylcysteine O-methyltransferase Ste14